MVTSSRYLMTGSPIGCAFCNEPFRPRDGYVEFWRTSYGLSAPFRQGLSTAVSVALARPGGNATGFSDLKRLSGLSNA
jgi:hypothetical protein